MGSNFTGIGLGNKSRIAGLYILAYIEGNRDGSLKTITDSRKTFFIITATILGYTQLCIMRKEVIQYRFQYSLTECMEGLLLLLEKAITA